jgi:hypothetical protein
MAIVGEEIPSFAGGTRISRETEAASYPARLLKPRGRMGRATLHADVGGDGAVEVRQIAKVVGPSVDAGARVEETVQILKAESQEPQNVLVPVPDNESLSGRSGSHVAPVEKR